MSHVAISWRATWQSADGPRSIQLTGRVVINWWAAWHSADGLRGNQLMSFASGGSVPWWPPYYRACLQFPQRIFSEEFTPMAFGNRLGRPTMGALYMRRGVGGGVYLGYRSWIPIAKTIRANQFVILDRKMMFNLGKWFIVLVRQTRSFILLLMRLVMLLVVRLIVLFRLATAVVS